MNRTPRIPYSSLLGTGSEDDPQRLLWGRGADWAFPSYSMLKPFGAHQGAALPYSMLPETFRIRPTLPFDPSYMLFSNMWDGGGNGNGTGNNDGNQNTNNDPVFNGNPIWLNQFGGGNGGGSRGGGIY